MEEIIYKYLLETFRADSHLATYCGEQAVFNQKAPDDMDDGWGVVQFPRCIFELNMQADSERKISGQLFVDIMCENTVESVQPELLAEIAKKAVDGCFFSNSELTISAQWSNTNPFGENDNKIYGITLVFDVMAYPKQQTEPLCPVKAVNLWLKTLYQDAYIIGYDELPQTWKPTDTTPAFYCRLSKLGEGRMKSTAAVTWIGADMQVYVMTPSEEKRFNITKNTTQLLINATRLMMEDNSPMLLDNINAIMGADPLREGQIQIKGTYGVLNEYIGIPLMSVYHSGLNAESEVTNG